MIIKDYCKAKDALMKINAHAYIIAGANVCRYYYYYYSSIY